MVARQRIPVSPRLRMRTLHNVHARTVMLLEIEIDRSEIAQFVPQVPHAGDGFEKDFRHHHRRQHAGIFAGILTQNFKSPGIDGCARGFGPWEKTALAVLWLVPLIARSIAQLTFIPLGVWAMLAVFMLVLRRGAIGFTFRSIAAPRAMK